MRKHLLLPLALFSAPLWAAGLEVTVEIPRLQVAEYHRPYVAIWLQNADQSHRANLAIWYDVKMKDKEGEKWLNDLRQWWRRSGRTLELPVDGVSGATRPVGSHSLSFDDSRAPLKDLPPGEYYLVVEAAREVGGREQLRIPFTWPADKPQQHNAQGNSELGALSLELTP
ncbi:DUF2271 domain-containing protein [Stutzerimonas kirkiae]|uniref:DUF2271 domain-containing protein n=1 Tax=Stutzerimonas kirkiae TaxID=2211392 RepID=A0A4Q9RD47_9GAMM|nr:DUF2271 domain-containing protein [Stutzerimonas kirkiae]TBU98946.1 DUF2271 domain-containing protein [Stutzerimonas kirkiae]TBV01596.1 DUF2271 domain-containing protein [Stutzerimonas kirkiae]TBV10300.1 DUF2271 domain-containing protein [Stutzerimonas kirkiae]TBV16910.1 DUF2271 domain-containing protein [Stutzerimonas kirkiae]